MEIKSNHFLGSQAVKQIQRSNGRTYTVRRTRIRYFFPDEFTAFYEALRRPKQRNTFKFLINTGARINEVRNIRVQDVDQDRHSIIIRWTKGRNEDGSRKMRIIPVSTQFIKWIKGAIRHYNLKPDDKFPMASTPAANMYMKSTLKRVGIKDYKMFSVHNVRKTLETWLIALDIDSLKISQHFGHSIAVASKFYVSPDTFSYDDKKMIRVIIGDLYLKRQEGWQ